MQRARLETQPTIPASRQRRLLPDGALFKPPAEDRCPADRTQRVTPDGYLYSRTPITSGVAFVSAVQVAAHRLSGSVRWRVTGGAGFGSRLGLAAGLVGEGNGIAARVGDGGDALTPWHVGRVFRTCTASARNRTTNSSTSST